VVVTGEGHLPGDQVVERRAQSIDVAAAVGVPGVDGLLIGHVGGGAEALAGAGQVAGVVGPLGQAQVAQLGHAGARGEDVVGLDVAVDDVARVGVLQAAGDVQGDVDGVADRQFAVLLEQQLGAGPVDVLQHQVVLAGGAVLADVQSADDVGVVEQDTGLGLAVEAVDVVLVAGQALAEHLEGDLAVVLAVVGQVNRAHATLAEAAQDAVLTEIAQVGRARGDGRTRAVGARGQDWCGPRPGVGAWRRRLGRARGSRPGRVQVGVVHVVSRLRSPWGGPKQRPTGSPSPHGTHRSATLHPAASEPSYPKRAARAGQPAGR
jgi:hypothetical protein